MILPRAFASRMVAQNYSLEMIGKVLNRANVATIARYAHLQLGPVRDAMEKIG